jgi:hypothetical protein
MLTQHARIDFIAYDPDGTVVLLGEAKNRLGTTESWAAKLRRNILAHGLLPPAKYFLIATPERVYAWSQEDLPLTEVPPQFTVDVRKSLAPYFAKLKQNPAEIGPGAFDLLVLTWLADLTRSAVDGSELDPSLRPLSEAGLLSSLRQAQIEINPS